VRYFVGFIGFVLLITALVGAVFYLLDQQPNSRFSTLLVKHKEIGGPVLGALITVLAAGLAFVSVQMQLRAQWRGVHVSEMTYWQQKLDGSDTAARGLKLVKETVETCVDTISEIDTAAPTPFYDRVLALQQTGVLDFSNFPPTGSSLINFDFNYQLAIIRTHLFTGRGDATKIPSLEPHLKTAFERIKAISERIDAAIAQQESDAKRAATALKKLDEDG
jgi:hypothetical protein